VRAGLYLLLVAMSVACSGSPSGTIDGISYKSSLKGSYTLVKDGAGREHVWFASADERPSLSLRIQGTPTPVGQEPRCKEDRTNVTWSSPGGFVLGRDGKLESDAPASVGMSLCSSARPGVSLYCNAFYEHGQGELSEQDREALAEACRGITVE